MRLFVAMSAAFAAALFFSVAHADTFVTMTAYTCDYHPNNPMTAHPAMCNVTRWGNTDVMSAGLACPAAWRGKHVQVPGYGTLVCDDTPRDEVWNGLPHLDLRLNDYHAARQFGVQTVQVYIGKPAPEPEPEPEPEQFCSGCIP